MEADKMIHENITGCNCCLGDEAVHWVDNENNALIDGKGDMLITIKDRTMRYKVKFCPNCGRKFGQI